MHFTKKIAAGFIIAVGLAASVCTSVAHAALTPVLVLSNSGGDMVQVTVYNGEPNNNVFLTVTPALNGTNLNLGTTDSKGYFSVAFSSANRGIGSNALAYVVVSGQQSAAISWPGYANTLSLSQYSANLLVGQTATIYSYGNNTLYVASNTNNTVAAVVTGNNQITVTGSNPGSTTATICSNNSGCAIVYITVNASGAQQALTLSPSTLSLVAGQGAVVSIYGGNGNNYYVSNNVNSSIASASITNATLTVSSLANGNTQVTVCQSYGACAVLSVTVTANTASNNTSYYYPTYAYEYNRWNRTQRRDTAWSANNPARNTPSITFPSNNQTLTNYPRSLTVRWQNDGAPRHSIEVSCDYCSSRAEWAGSPTYYTANNSATSYSGITLPGDNQYRVRVQSIDSYGNKSAWSDYTYFRFDTRSYSYNR